MRTKIKFYKKVFCVFLALNLLLEIFYPTAAWALTSGPTQPEMESFEPIGTTQMVDLFSGDFNYNIPLMTVPGPNGGYPINLAYHAGIGVEQEASWVGLGWNVNPGEINREMRGLPDDFNGDAITKTLNLAADNTYGIETGAGTELFGFGISAGQEFYYNSYKGTGQTISLDISEIDQNATSSYFAPGLSLSYDADGGLGVSPYISYHYIKDERDNIWSLGVTLNSKEGVTGVFLKERRDKFKAHISMEKNTGTLTVHRENMGTVAGAGVTYSGGSFVPNTTWPMAGSITHGGLKYGTEIEGAFVNFSLMYSDVENAVSTSSIGFEGYGYLYSQNVSKSNGTFLMDFSREKDVPVARDAPSVPVPIANNDVYLVKGQGIGGVFRPYRTDVGTYKDPTIISESSGSNITFEGGAGAAAVRIGADYGYNSSESQSGAWNNHESDESYIDKFTFLDIVGQDDNPTSDPSYPSVGQQGYELYEPWVFKSSGEHTATNVGYLNNYLNDEPVRFALKWNGGTKAMIDNGIERDGNALVLNDIAANGANQIIYGVNGLSQERMKCTQSFQTTFMDQLQHRPTPVGGRVKNIFPFNSFCPNDPNAHAYDYSNNPSGHIGSISVINPDGNKYEYGIPVYNLSQEDVVFAVNGVTPNNTNLAPKRVDFNSTDASILNSNGLDNYYSKTEIPKYVHSYLLTAIYSPDYVDLTGNGPSDDDLGYFVKFNYTKRDEARLPGSGTALGPYQWRTPYVGANFIAGKLSNINDDKAAFSYGTKEMYYVNSIETKTHIAIFKLLTNGNCGLGGRHDSKGVDAELNYISGNTSSTNKQNQVFALSKIQLFSKSGNQNYCSCCETGASNDGTDNSTGGDQTFAVPPSCPVPIKEVDFVYNYELCPNTENSDATVANGDGGTGKLTLKKVFFTYQNNNKGSFSPYQFDYGASDPDQNPAYCDPSNTTNKNNSVLQMDRWGNYKPDKPTNGISNTDNPYVDQGDLNGDGVLDGNDKILRDKRASAWCLQQITLPSGGVIKVDYESDDYTYVQEKHAMEMLQITRVQPFESVYASNSLNFVSGQKPRIYFKLDNPTSNYTQALNDVNNYVSGLIEGDDIFFKVFMKMKRYPLVSSLSGFADDYVEGYATYAGTSGVQVNGVGQYEGFIELERASFKFPHLLSGLYNPIALAGWQNLRFQRSDLMDAPNTTAGNIYDVCFDLFKFVGSVTELFNGYYNYCFVRGFCNKLVLDNTAPLYRPSYVRLNCHNNVKYGGGHRVSKIRINDSWDKLTSPAESAFEYGQQYTYRLADNTPGTIDDNPSSGVASYEPLIGGEEIPHHLPVRFSDDQFLARDKALYIEKPYCESYYPSANVGYSRVVVSSLDRTPAQTSKTSKGYTVNEFYTAKDFPVSVNLTDVGTEKLVFPIPIPFIGAITFNNKAYSQGFSVILNDMHGKDKSVATYSSNVNLYDLANPPQPITKTEYIYSTNATYDPNSSNSLNNTVEVMDGEGSHRTAIVGETTEIFNDIRENSNVTESIGGQGNLDIQYPDLIVPSFIPSYAYGQASFRSIVTNKIISRNGILQEVRQYNDGSLVSTKNLMFDAETGVPVLTQVTNDFNAPIYKYDIQAHWAYANMGAAYKNIGATRKNITVSSSGLCSINNPDLFLNVGDEVNIITRAADGSMQDISTCWVKTMFGLHDNTVTNDKIALMNESGVAPVISSGASYDLVVVRSVKTNQLSTDAGTIVSLKNPVTQRNFPVFTAYNTARAALGSGTALPLPGYTDCSTGQVYTATVTLSGNSLEFSRPIPGGGGGDPTGCGFTINFPSSVSSANIYQYQLTKAGNTVIASNGTNTVVIPFDNISPCFPECTGSNDILNASAIEFNDSWTYNYADVGDPQGQPIAASSPSPLTTLTNLNPYRWGAKGIWRVYRNNAFQVDRDQVNNIAGDGTYKKFTLFDWNPLAINQDWTQSTTVTRYSPFGYELENKDILNIFSSALYGYNNSVVTAVANNSSYFETAFDGIEDYSGSWLLSLNHGHMVIQSSSSLGVNIFGGSAHTGKHGIYVMPNEVISTQLHVGGSSNGFIAQPNKRYVMSAWINTSMTGSPITISGASNVITEPLTDKIEGWQKYDIEFTTPASGVVTISFSFGASTNGSIDDLRIQPFSSTLVTYVYDPRTLWLMAELDNRNYATFYNYDEEGTLVQVKKETVNGISTIKSSRQNIQRP